MHRLGVTIIQTTVSDGHFHTGPIVTEGLGEQGPWPAIASDNFGGYFIKHFHPAPRLNPQYRIGFGERIQAREIHPAFKDSARSELRFLPNLCESISGLGNF